jgi:hypothetical protein
MQYFVIGEDGYKYGPADVLQLNSWIIEGRLTPTTRLEQVGSGVQVYASTVPGLNFPMTTPPGGAGPTTTYQAPTQSPFSQPNPYQTPASYPRAGAPSYQQNTQDLTYSWVCFAIGWLCCPVVANGFGIFYANRAQQQGINGAKVAYWFNLGYIIFVVAVFLISFLAGAAGGFR